MLFSLKTSFVKLIKKESITEKKEKIKVVSTLIVCFGLKKKKKKKKIE